MATGDRLASATVARPGGSKEKGGGVGPGSGPDPSGVASERRCHLGLDREDRRLPQVLLHGARVRGADEGPVVLLGEVGGRAYATIIAAGSDGEGAQRQIDRIATGWRLKRVADPWIVITHAQSAAEIAAQKSLSATDLARANELGRSMAEAIKLGIY